MQNMTGKRGAPLGNRNGEKKNYRFSEALTRAIAQDDGRRIRAAAEQLLDLASAGEQWAVRELADRLDGRPAQQMQLTGDAANPISLLVTGVPRPQDQIEQQKVIEGEIITQPVESKESDA